MWTARVTAIVSLGFIGLGSIPARAKAAEFVEIAGIENYLDLSDSQHPGGGEITELVRRTFSAMGLRPRIVFLPRKRAYAETKSGRFLATFPWYRDEEREQDFLFSDPLYEANGKVVVPSAADIPLFTRANMHGKRSCDLLGSHFQSQLFESEQVVVTRVSEMSQCLKMLKERRIDFYFSPPTITQAELGTGAKIVPDDLDLVLRLHLIIARSHPQGRKILADFNRELARSRRQAIGP